MKQPLKFPLEIKLRDKPMKNGKPRTFVYWKERDAKSGRLRYRDMYWDGLKTDGQLDWILTMSQMPDGPQRRRHIRATPWLKSGGYSDALLFASLMMRLRHLKQSLKEKQRGHLLRARANTSGRRKLARGENNERSLNIWILHLFPKWTSEFRRKLLEKPMDKWDQHCLRKFIEQTEEFHEWREAAKQLLARKFGSISA